MFFPYLSLFMFYAAVDRAQSCENVFLSLHSLSSPFSGTPFSLSSMSVLCVFFFLAHCKTVRRVYRQRSHVSPRIAQCVAVSVYFCVWWAALYVIMFVDMLTVFSLGAPSIPLHFLIRYRIFERRPSQCGTVEIPFL